jgi:polyhydroxybutyrate depolymerase
VQQPTRPIRSGRRRPRGLALPVVALTAAVVLASCGSGSGSGGGAGQGATTTTTRAEPDEHEAPTTAVVLDPWAQPRGTVTHGTLSVGGRQRTYRLYVPGALPDGPVPLLVGLHGGTGWGDQFAAVDGIEGLAEANGFIVAHPDGVEVGDGPGGVWNGGVCCGVAAREGVDDVGFVAALIAEVAAGHEVDPRRTYAFGHSNGGIMSYRLACELSDRIAGIGVVAGTLGVDTCAPGEPVSVIHVHGTADENVPITGGTGPRSAAGVDFPSPTAGFDALATADGCPAPRERTDGDVTVALRRPCDGGTAAEFVTIATAQHPWPGASPGRSARRAGVPYPDYDATAAVVAFLLSHPRP